MDHIQGRTAEAPAAMSATYLPQDLQTYGDTFDRYGNLFGAALPISLEDALACGKLAQGGLLALGGFSHAGDYSAAALIDWRRGTQEHAR